jgi:hypothetical protein
MYHILVLRVIRGEGHLDKVIIYKLKVTHTFKKNGIFDFKYSVLKKLFIIKSFWIM